MSINSDYASSPSACQSTPSSYARAANGMENIQYL